MCELSELSELSEQSPVRDWRIVKSRGRPKKVRHKRYKRYKSPDLIPGVFDCGPRGVMGLHGGRGVAVFGHVFISSPIRKRLSIFLEQRSPLIKEATWARSAEVRHPRRRTHPLPFTGSLFRLLLV